MANMNIPKNLDGFEAIAQVKEVLGVVIATNSQGQQRAILPGDYIYSDDVVDFKQLVLFTPEEFNQHLLAIEQQLLEDIDNQIAAEKEAQLAKLEAEKKAKETKEETEDDKVIEEDQGTQFTVIEHQLSGESSLEARINTLLAEQNQLQFAKKVVNALSSEKSYADSDTFVDLSVKPIRTFEEKLEFIQELTLAKFDGLQAKPDALKSYYESITKVVDLSSIIQTLLNAPDDAKISLSWPVIVGSESDPFVIPEGEYNKADFFKALGVDSNAVLDGNLDLSNIPTHGLIIPNINPFLIQEGLLEVHGLSAAEAFKGFAGSDTDEDINFTVKISAESLGSSDKKDGLDDAKSTVLYEQQLVHIGVDAVATGAVLLKQDGAFSDDLKTDGLFGSLNGITAITDGPMKGIAINFASFFPDSDGSETRVLTIKLPEGMGLDDWSYGGMLRNDVTLDGASTNQYSLLDEMSAQGWTFNADKTELTLSLDGKSAALLNSLVLLNTPANFERMPLIDDALNVQITLSTTENVTDQESDTKNNTLVQAFNLSYDDSTSNLFPASDEVKSFALAEFTNNPENYEGLSIQLNSVWDLIGLDKQEIPSGSSGSQFVISPGGGGLVANSGNTVQTESAEQSSLFDFSALKESGILKITFSDVKEVPTFTIEGVSLPEPEITGDVYVYSIRISDLKDQPDALKIIPSAFSSQDFKVSVDLVSNDKNIPSIRILSESTVQVGVQAQALQYTDAEKPAPGAYNFEMDTDSVTFFKNNTVAFDLAIKANLTNTDVDGSESHTIKVYLPTGEASTAASWGLSSTAAKGWSLGNDAGGPFVKYQGPIGSDPIKVPVTVDHTTYKELQKGGDGSSFKIVWETVDRDVDSDAISKVTSDTTGQTISGGFEHAPSGLALSEVQSKYNEDNTIDVPLADVFVTLKGLLNSINPKIAANLADPKGIAFAPVELKGLLKDVIGSATLKDTTDINNRLHDIFSAFKFTVTQTGAAPDVILRDDNAKQYLADKASLTDSDLDSSTYSGDTLFQLFKDWLRTGEPKDYSAHLEPAANSGEGFTIDYSIDFKAIDLNAGTTDHKDFSGITVSSKVVLDAKTATADVLEDKIEAFNDSMTPIKVSIDAVATDVSSSLGPVVGEWTEMREVGRNTGKKQLIEEKHIEEMPLFQIKGGVVHMPLAFKLAVPDRDGSESVTIKFTLPGDESLLKQKDLAKEHFEWQMDEPSHGWQLSEDGVTVTRTVSGEALQLLEQLTAAKTDAAREAIKTALGDEGEGLLKEIEGLSLAGDQLVSNIPLSFDQDLLAHMEHNPIQVGMQTTIQDSTTNKNDDQSDNTKTSDQVFSLTYDRKFLDPMITEFSFDPETFGKKELELAIDRHQVIEVDLREMIRQIDVQYKALSKIIENGVERDIKTFTELEKAQIKFFEDTKIVFEFFTQGGFPEGKNPIAFFNTTPVELEVTDNSLTASGAQLKALYEEIVADPNWEKHLENLPKMYIASAPYFDQDFSINATSYVNDKLDNQLTLLETTSYTVDAAVQSALDLEIGGARQLTVNPRMEFETVAQEQNPALFKLAGEDGQTMRAMKFTFDVNTVFPDIDGSESHWIVIKIDTSKLLYPPFDAAGNEHPKAGLPIGDDFEATSYIFQEEATLWDNYGHGVFARRVDNNEKEDFDESFSFEVPLSMVPIAVQEGHNYQEDEAGNILKDAAGNPILSEFFGVKVDLLSRDQSIEELDEKDFELNQFNNVDRTQINTNVGVETIGIDERTDNVALTNEQRKELASDDGQWKVADVSFAGAMQALWDKFHADLARLEAKFGPDANFREFDLLENSSQAEQAEYEKLLQSKIEINIGLIDQAHLPEGFFESVDANFQYDGSGHYVLTGNDLATALVQWNEGKTQTVTDINDVTHEVPGLLPVMYFRTDLFSATDFSVSIQAFTPDSPRPFYHPSDVLVIVDGEAQSIDRTEKPEGATAKTGIETNLNFLADEQGQLSGKSDLNVRVNVNLLDNDGSEDVEVTLTLHGNLPFERLLLLQSPDSHAVWTKSLDQPNVFTARVPASDLATLTDSFILRGNTEDFVSLDTQQNNVLGEKITFDMRVVTHEKIEDYQVHHDQDDPNAVLSKVSTVSTQQDPGSENKIEVATPTNDQFVDIQSAFSEIQALLKGMSEDLKAEFLEHTKLTFNVAEMVEAGETSDANYHLPTFNAKSLPAGFVISKDGHSVTLEGKEALNTALDAFEAGTLNTAIVLAGDSPRPYYFNGTVQYDDVDGKADTTDDTKVVNLFDQVDSRKIAQETVAEGGAPKTHTLELKAAFTALYEEYVKPHANELVFSLEDQMQKIQAQIQKAHPADINQYLKTLSIELHVDKPVELQLVKQTALPTEFGKDAVSVSVIDLKVVEQNNIVDGKIVKDSFYEITGQNLIDTYNAWAKGTADNNASSLLIKGYTGPFNLVASVDGIAGETTYPIDKAPKTPLNHDNLLSLPDMIDVLHPDFSAAVIAVKLDSPHDLIKPPEMIDSRFEKVDIGNSTNAKGESVDIYEYQLKGDAFETAFQKWLTQSIKADGTFDAGSFPQTINVYQVQDFTIDTRLDHGLGPDRESIVLSENALVQVGARDDLRVAAPERESFNYVQETDTGSVTKVKLDLTKAFEMLKEKFVVNGSFSPENILNSEIALSIIGGGKVDGVGPSIISPGIEKVVMTGGINKAGAEQWIMTNPDADKESKSASHTGSGDILDRFERWLKASSTTDQGKAIREDAATLELQLNEHKDEDIAIKYELTFAKDGVAGEETVTFRPDQFIAVDAVVNGVKNLELEVKDPVFSKVSGLIGIFTVSYTVKMDFPDKDNSENHEIKLEIYDLQGNLIDIPFKFFADSVTAGWSRGPNNEIIFNADKIDTGLNNGHFEQTVDLQFNIDDLIREGYLDRSTDGRVNQLNFITNVTVASTESTSGLQLDTLSERVESLLTPPEKDFEQFFADSQAKDAQTIVRFASVNEALVGRVEVDESAIPAEQRLRDYYEAQQEKITTGLDAAVPNNEVGIVNIAGVFSKINTESKNLLKDDQWFDMKKVLSDLVALKSPTNDLSQFKVTLDIKSSGLLTDLSEFKNADGSNQWKIEGDRWTINGKDLVKHLVDDKGNISPLHFDIQKGSISDIEIGVTTAVLNTKTGTVTERPFFFGHEETVGIGVNAFDHTLDLQDIFEKVRDNQIDLKDATIELNLDTSNLQVALPLYLEGSGPSYNISLSHFKAEYQEWLVAQKDHPDSTPALIQLPDSVSVGEATATLSYANQYDLNKTSTMNFEAYEEPEAVASGTIHTKKDFYPNLGAAIETILSKAGGNEDSFVTGSAIDTARLNSATSTTIGKAFTDFFKIYVRVDDGSPVVVDLNAAGARADFADLARAYRDIAKASPATIAKETDEYNTLNKAFIEKYAPSLIITLDGNLNGPVIKFEVKDTLLNYTQNLSGSIINQADDFWQTTETEHHTVPPANLQNANNPDEIRTASSGSDSSGSDSSVNTSEAFVKSEAFVNLRVVVEGILGKISPELVARYITGSKEGKLWSPATADEIGWNLDTAKDALGDQKAFAEFFTIKLTVNGKPEIISLEGHAAAFTELARAHLMLNAAREVSHDATKKARADGVAESDVLELPEVKAFDAANKAYEVVNKAFLQEVAPNLVKEFDNTLETMTVSSISVADIFANAPNTTIPQYTQKEGGTLDASDDSWAIASGLKAEYFQNTSFAGTPLVRVDPNINFTGSDNNFGTQERSLFGSSFFKSDFSARWTGQIVLDKPGDYAFEGTGNNFIKMFLTDPVTGIVRKLIDIGSGNEGTYTQLSVGFSNLEAGKKYNITFELTDNGGTEIAILKWKEPGSSIFVAVPSDHFTLSPIHETALRDAVPAAYQQDYVQTTLDLQPAFQQAFDQKVEVDQGRIIFTFDASLYLEMPKDALGKPIFKVTNEPNKWELDLSSKLYTDWLADKTSHPSFNLLVKADVKNHATFNVDIDYEIQKFDHITMEEYNQALKEGGEGILYHELLDASGKETGKGSLDIQAVFQTIQLDPDFSFEGAKLIIRFDETNKLVEPLPSYLSLQSNGILIISMDHPDTQALYKEWQADHGKGAVLPGFTINSSEINHFTASFTYQDSYKAADLGDEMKILIDNFETLMANDGKQILNNGKEIPTTALQQQLWEVLSSNYLDNQAQFKKFTIEFESSDPNGPLDANFVAQAGYVALDGKSYTWLKGIEPASASVHAGEERAPVNRYAYEVELDMKAYQVALEAAKADAAKVSAAETIVLTITDVKDPDLIAAKAFLASLDDSQLHLNDFSTLMVNSLFLPVRADVRLSDLSIKVVNEAENIQVSDDKVPLGDAFTEFSTEMGVDLSQTLWDALVQILDNTDGNAAQIVASSLRINTDIKTQLVFGSNSTDQWTQDGFNTAKNDAPKAGSDAEKFKSLFGSMKLPVPGSEPVVTKTLAAFTAEEYKNLSPNEPPLSLIFPYSTDRNLAKDNSKTAIDESADKKDTFKDETNVDDWFVDYDTKFVKDHTISGDMLLALAKQVSAILDQGSSGTAAKEAFLKALSDFTLQAPPKTLDGDVVANTDAFVLNIKTQSLIIHDVDEKGNVLETPQREVKTDVILPDTFIDIVPTQDKTLDRSSKISVQVDRTFEDIIVDADGNVIQQSDEAAHTAARSQMVMDIDLQFVNRDAEIKHGIVIALPRSHVEGKNVTPYNWSLTTEVQSWSLVDDPVAYPDSILLHIFLPSTTDGRVSDKINLTFDAEVFVNENISDRTPIQDEIQIYTSSFKASEQAPLDYYDINNVNKNKLIGTDPSVVNQDVIRDTDLSSPTTLNLNSEAYTTKSGTEGEDVFRLSDNSQNTALFTGKGDDTVYGGDGKDIVLENRSAAGGNDYVVLGGGADIAATGAGDDVVYADGDRTNTSQINNQGRSYFIFEGDTLDKSQRVDFEIHYQENTGIRNYYKSNWASQEYSDFPLVTSTHQNTVLDKNADGSIGKRATEIVDLISTGTGDDTIYTHNPNVDKYHGSFVLAGQGKDTIVSGWGSDVINLSIANGIKMVTKQPILTSDFWGEAAKSNGTLIGSGDGLNELFRKFLADMGLNNLNEDLAHFGETSSYDPLDIRGNIGTGHYFGDGLEGTYYDKNRDIDGGLTGYFSDSGSSNEVFDHKTGNAGSALEMFIAKANQLFNDKYTHNAEQIIDAKEYDAALKQINMINHMTTEDWRQMESGQSYTALHLTAGDDVTTSQDGRDTPLNKSDGDTDVIRYYLDSVVKDKADTTDFAGNRSFDTIYYFDTDKDHGDKIDLSGFFNELFDMPAFQKYRTIETDTITKMENEGKSPDEIAEAISTSRFAFIKVIGENFQQDSLEVSNKDHLTDENNTVSEREIRVERSDSLQSARIVVTDPDNEVTATTNSDNNLEFRYEIALLVGVQANQMSIDNLILYTPQDLQ